jgi:hypothetical protein
VKQIVQAVCGPRLPRCCSVVLNSSDVLADARIYDSGRARCSGFFRREPGRAVHRAGNQLSDHGTAAQAVHCCQRFQACGQRRRDFCGHRDGGRAGMSHATRFTGTQPKRLLDPPAWSALEPHVPTRARLVASAPTTTGWREISDARLVIYADVGHLPSRASETVCDPPLARRWPDLVPLPERGARSTTLRPGRRDIGRSRLPRSGLLLLELGQEVAQVVGYRPLGQPEGEHRRK